MGLIVERLRRVWAAVQPHLVVVADWLRDVWAHPRQRWIAVASVVVLLALASWALWPTSEPPAPRARQYLAYTACLLTDDHGVTGSAAPVWAGMQDASLATRAKAQYLSVAGPQTAENAAPFLAALAQGHCDQVFVAGDAPVAAVRTTAPTFPRVTFYVVGKAEPRGNVSIVDAGSPETIRTAVARIIKAGVTASTHP